MIKQEILDRVLSFCNVRGDAFYWRDEPTRSELFRIFLDSLNGANVTADEIREFIRHEVEPIARWDLPMQERTADICAAWDDWFYAIGNVVELQSRSSLHLLST